MAAMDERYTSAVVLDRFDAGERDGTISFFTERYGKLVARARSIRAATSKLSAHLQPFHFVKVRFAPRTRGDGFVVIDSVLDDAFVPSVTRRRSDCAPIARVIDLYAPELDADAVVWRALEALFGDASRDASVDRLAQVILSRVGFDPRYATCAACGASAVTHFVVGQGAFVCASCALSLPQNEVLYFV